MGITGAIISTKRIKVPQVDIPSSILSEARSNEL
jgi:hypothetical protein